MLKLKLLYLATWYEELSRLKSPWCWEGLREGGEGDDRGWDGWMASLTSWTWVWVNSGSWWWTGRPGVLWFTGSQRVGHDWATELNWTDLINVPPFCTYKSELCKLSLSFNIQLSVSKICKTLLLTSDRTNSSWNFLRGCSWVIIFNLVWIQFSIPFLDQLTNFLSTDGRTW